MLCYIPGCKYEYNPAGYEKIPGHKKFKPDTAKDYPDPYQTV